jgi:ADP-ribose pyrophosphatase YjhB (NUDIX family)
MYKIYINNVPVYLTSKHGAALPQTDSSNSDILITDHTAKKDILETIDTINAAKGLRACYLLARNPKNVLNHFKKFYRVVEAAGGVVLNSNDEILLIFRRGKWDLPKGKLDDGETKRRAAIREVKEETGVKKIRVIQSLKLYAGKQSCTYHSYIENEVACLKASYWFLMRTTDKGILVPQIEEDIVQAEWISRDRLGEYMENSYGSVRDIIEVTQSLL